MFNLELAISEWRREMAAAGIKNRDALNELESHLRDDTDQQMRSGLSAQQAFQAAVQRIGQASVLRTEFAKVRGRNWALRRTLKGIVSVVLAGTIVLLGAHAFFKVEMTLGEQLLGFAMVALILLSFCGWRYAVRVFHIGPEDVSTFTPSAKHTLEVARQEARCFHHDFVGTEHLLLGLLHSKNGVVAEIVQRLGVDSEAVGREVENLVGLGPDRNTATNLPCTPRAKRALWLAGEEAKAMQHSHVRPEHIFLGLLLEGEGVAALALKNLGVDFQRTRDEILKSKSN